MKKTLLIGGGLLIIIAVIITAVLLNSNKEPVAVTPEPTKFIDVALAVNKLPSS